jgi:hypothetical protein
MLPPSWKEEVQKAAEQAANADREQRQARINDAAANISAAIKTLSDAQNAQTGHEDRNQKINVRLNALTIFLVFLTVIFTGMSWWAFRDQLTEMRKVYDPISASANAAKDSLIASQRAWVKIEEIGLGGGGLAIDENGVSVAISFQITNVGNSPATNITHHAGLVVLASGVSLPQEQQELCDAVTKAPFGLAFALFPGEHFPANMGFGQWSLGVNAGPAEVKKGLSGPEKKNISLFVVGCVDYTFATDPTGHHQTGFIRDLVKKIPSVISVDEGMVPVDKLILRET